MSWRDEKADHLQKSRDFSFLHGGEDDRSQREVQRSRPGKSSEDRVNQEKLLRLKALEKQRADKQKKHYVESSSPEAHAERRETERSAGVSGSKRGGPSGNDKFGSFFGKVERVVAKRVIDEQREREIAVRERRVAEAEKARERAESSRNAKQQSTRPSSSSGSRPVPKAKAQNPVTVKAQKLKDNRDYSFLFSDEPPSKPQAAEARAQPSKEPRPGADSGARQKVVQKLRPASNGSARPAAGQVPSSSQGRKVGASRPVSVGERDSNARDPRAHESERRSEKESRQARAERDTRAERDGRFESDRRVEVGRGAGPSRVGLAGKSASKGTPAKLPTASDRDRRPAQERPPSGGRPKPTNHDRPVARVPSTMKSASLSRLSEGTGQRMSQSGTTISRERVVQKSTTVSQSVQRSDLSTMKRRMGGEPVRKPVIVAKANDGRRVDRSRYGDTDSESEMMRRLVAGGPMAPQPAGSRPLKSVAGAGPMRRVSEEPTRRKTMDAPVRRRAEEEPLRRRSSDEVLRSRPVVAKERKRARHSDSESESDDERQPRKSGVSSIIQKLFRYNPNKYADLDDEDDRNMETSFKHIQAEERRSARLAREEDEREQELIEAEERAERERKVKRQKMMK